MNVSDLENLGFSITAGQVDFGNKNYGFLTPSGPVLTPEGEEFAKQLQAATDDPESSEEPEIEPEEGQPAAPRRGRRRKAEGGGDTSAQ